MKQNQIQERITNENVRITAENVRHIAECIALSAVKKMMRFAGHLRSLEKLYAGLVEDIYHSKGYASTLSDGYDLASEIICFLCPYIGHNLDDLAYKISLTYQSPRFFVKFLFLALFPFLLQHRILIRILIYGIAVLVLYKAHELHKQSLAAHAELFAKLLTCHVVVLGVGIFFFLLFNFGVFIPL